MLSFQDCTGTFPQPATVMTETAIRSRPIPLCRIGPPVRASAYGERCRPVCREFSRTTSVDPAKSSGASSRSTREPIRERGLAHREIMAASSNIQRPNASGRILVADDDPAIVDLVAEALRSEGYVCDCVGTADAAACAMATVSYDLLITDIRMPGNDTFATLRELRPGDNTPPIIVMTGQPTVGTVLEANRLSVVNYLIKPVDVQALRDLAALAIGKGKVLRALRKARTEIAVWQEGLAALETALL